MRYSFVACATITASLSAFLGLCTGKAEEELRQCVPEYWSNIDAFSSALSNVTFVFQFDTPYILPSEQIRNRPSLPFICTDSAMKGVFVDWLLEMGRTLPEIDKAQCVYSGENCSFDNLVRFVGHAAQNGAHQFIAGSYLLNLERRRTRHTIQSAPLVVDQMVLMYRNDVNPWPWRDAWNRIWKPFHISAWGVTFGFGAAILGCIALFVIRFAPRELYFTKKVIWLFNHPEGKWSMTMKFAWLLVVAKFTIYVAILVLMYEIAVAVSVFQERPALVTDITQLESFGPSKIAVVKEAASETIMRFFIDPAGKYSDSAPPWRRGKSLADMLPWLDSREVEMVFTFLSTVKFTLQRMRLCNKYSSTLVSKEEFGGWYYSSALSEELREKLDKKLNDLFMRRVPLMTMQKLGHCELSVGPREDEISYRVLLLQLGITVLPFLLLFVFLLVFQKDKGGKRRPKDDEDPEQDESTVENDASC